MIWNVPWQWSCSVSRPEWQTFPVEVNGTWDEFICIEDCIWWLEECKFYASRRKSILLSDILVCELEFTLVCCELEPLVSIHWSQAKWMSFLKVETVNTSLFFKVMLRWDQLRPGQCVKPSSLSHNSTILYISRASAAMKIPISSGIYGTNICEEEQEVNLQRCPW